MADIKEMVRHANDLRNRANQESDPHIRDRLNHMADTYNHIAEIEAGIVPPSLHGLMDAFMREDKPTSD